MTAAALRPALVRPGEVRREHVGPGHLPGLGLAARPASSVRSNRLAVFDEFPERWPRLEDWFTAPLRERLSPTGTAASAGSTRTAAPAS